MNAITRHNNFLLIICTITLLLSALLMFAVQPMLGKMLLPKVGGAPAGWIVAVAFFQAALLAGYLIAHLIARYGSRTHGLLYIGLLLLGLPFLPLSLGQIDLNHGVAGAVFVSLAVSAAIPFIALAATSSTIQRLFAASGHPSARDPYFLYAASNIGSFIGLLGYPLLAEPFIGVFAQSYLWFAGFAVLIALALACVILTPPTQAQQRTKSSITLKQSAIWLFLSFLPSCLMMAVTTLISTEVISFPLLWVIPLAVYLFTFIIAFAQRNLFPARVLYFFYACGLSIAFSYIFNVPVAKFMVASWEGAAVHILAFGAIALFYHSKLAELRPNASNPQNLTYFYLIIALGGALGGALNAFVFPFAFSRLIEYPLLICISILIFLISSKPLTKKICLVLFVVSIGSVFFKKFSDDREIATHRNFFGYSRIWEHKYDLKGEDRTTWRLTHGTTLHGYQYQNKKLKQKPTSYYLSEGPLGDLIRLTKPWDTLALGLGTGTVNCTVPPDSTLTFIEIDRDMADIAKKYFTFLSGCPRETPVRIMFGDGRLTLDKLTNKTYDLIIVDAFTSDAIPTHLLTVEAIEKFKSHLKTGGVIAFHISNRYFNLAPQLRTQAEATGLNVLMRRHFPDRITSLGVGSVWIAASINKDRLYQLDENQWLDVPLDKKRKVWTDDYVNLLSTLYILR